MEENTKRKQMIKKIAGIFLVVMLLLTFFSNTIMNYSLPEVASEVVSSGTVSAKVRGQGEVETNSDYEVVVSGSRVIKEVKVEVGDTVKEGDVLFTFEEGENEELNMAEDELAAKELEYTKTLLAKLPTDYTLDNMDIEDARDELEKANQEKTEAEQNKIALDNAKEEEKRAKENVETQQAKVDDLQAKVDAYGEVGDYETAQEEIKAIESELEALKIQLSDLQEDLADLQKLGEDTKQLEREIRDKKTEISNKEQDLKTKKEQAKALKTTSSSYEKKKKNLEKESGILADYQKTLEEKSGLVAELSAKMTVEEANENLKLKQDTLTRALLALQEKQETDAMSKQSEDLDMKVMKEEIEELKSKVEKLKSSSDVEEVKAKEEGVVCQIDFEEGDKVTADTPLARIQLSKSGYLVKITVTKAQSKLIRVGDEATVENVWDVDDLTATVKSIKADPENPNQNMIVTFEVMGDVNPGQNLALSVGEKSSRYDTVVPNSAIKEDNDGKFVLVVTVKGTPLGNRYKVVRANVEVLASDDTSSAVSGDVFEYDNVVIYSAEPLETGTQVRLKE